MSKTVFLGEIVTPTQIISNGVLVVNEDRIEFVGDKTQALASNYDLSTACITDGYILPGLVDIHSHGGGGASLPNATTYSQAMQAVLEHRRAGTTSYVASLVTASAEVLRERVKLLTQLCEDNELAGIHLEGPFVSYARCGAQDPTYIQAGNVELTKELCALAKGHVKWMTLAPEVANTQGDNSVAQALIENKALPSWGHTDACPQDMERALAWSYELLARTPDALSKRPLVTHLFNGMRPIMHRDPGPIMACISAAKQHKAVVEVIADAVHLDPALVREIYELVGRENMALITDAMEAAGMPDGDYELGSQKVVVKAGVARLAEGGAIAGGTARLLDVVRVCIKAGIDLVDTVYMASTTPAVVLGDENIGSLQVGKYADFLLLAHDQDLSINAVYRRGTLVK